MYLFVNRAFGPVYLPLSFLRIFVCDAHEESPLYKNVVFRDKTRLMNWWVRFVRVLVVDRFGDRDDVLTMFQIWLCM
jgi:hypothetical protein